MADASSATSGATERTELYVSMPYEVSEYFEKGMEPRVEQVDKHCGRLIMIQGRSQISKLSHTLLVR